MKYLLLLLLFLYVKVLPAQNQDLLKNFLTVENGLSHNEVTSIVQDHYGFIWIGTRGGLNRYDGYEFKIFNQVPGDSNSLVNPSIESLFVDSKGNIWIGTKSGGVSKYNPKTGNFTNIVSNYKRSNPIVSSNRVLSFYEDNNGKIWIGTWQNGLVIYDQTTNTSESVLDGTINTIIESTEDKVWVGGSEGLYAFNIADYSYTAYQTGCQEIAYDERINAIWIVGGGSRLRKFDIRTNEITQYPVSIANEDQFSGSHNLESVLLDKNDRIWVGTWGTGFYIFNKANETFTRYSIYPENRQSLNKDYDAVLDIFQDKDNNIWLGTNGGGICYLTPKLKFNTIGYHPEKEKGLVNTRIMSVVSDQKGNLWMGTIGSGLFWSPDRENIYQVEYPYNVSQSRFFIIKYISESDNGTVWVGTNTGTYFVDFAFGKPQMIQASNFFGNQSFSRQAVSFLDDKDIFFVGTLQNGLFLYDKNSNYKGLKRLWSNNPSSGDLNSNRISYLLKDTKNRIWIGTYNGLHIFNREDSTILLAENKFTLESELTGNIITCIDEDQHGNIWIGTPNGLNRLNESNTAEGKFSLQIYTSEDGLASNFIKGIAHDLNGNIWVSTNVGISKLITKNGTRVINFDETDGVLGQNFTEASVFQNRKTHEIFFGGSEGLTWFNSDEIATQSELRRPILTGLSILNRTIEIGKEYDSRIVLEKAISQTSEITLSYRQNKIEIQFSALDYESQGKNRYQVFLENYDNEWSDLGTRRFAIFNNLKPGEYLLHVKCSNRHGIWNDEAATLAIIVKPPFWQTWYALIFYILVVVGIVTVIRWNAIKQVRLANSLEMEKLQHEQDLRINEMKLRFFTNLSHEFRTPLTLILAPLKELLTKKHEYQLSNETENKIGIVQNNSLRLMKLVNQLLDFRKVESGKMKLLASNTNLEDFVSEVCHPFHELARINNIEFKLTVSLKNKNIWIDREKIEVVINNLISNAFKYIQGNGKIEVSLFEEEDEVLLSVSDNGPGILKTEIDNIFERFYRVKQNNVYGSSGIGLALVKRYVELHKGTISVVSEQNKHTEFTIVLKKGTTHLQREEMLAAETKEPNFVRKEQFFGSVLSPKETRTSKSEDCILLVEDNAEVRNYLHSVLEPHYCIYLAENGVEGFNLAEQKLPNLIVSDVMMPQMDGFEFCKKIRENETTETIPFIFLTAKSDEQFLLMGTQLGADDFLSKPFDPNLLLEKIKNILESRKKLQKQYSKSVRLEPSDIEITSSEEIFIEKIISIIENNLQNHKFSSDVLATEMNMSASSLYRKLKGLTNSSTAEFIRSIRIKRAAQLLADKEKTITEIAYGVGFNDVKHFRTVFQKQFSCSPSEYREKL